jgi:hypothetical protein
MVSNVAVTAARISAMRSLLPRGRCERWPYSNHCLHVNSAALMELIARHASNVTAHRSIVDIRSWVVEADGESNGGGPYGEKNQRVRRDRGCSHQIGQHNLRRNGITNLLVKWRG